MKNIAAEPIIVDGSNERHKEIQAKDTC